MEMMPTITIHIKFFVKIAVMIVGIEASRFSRLIKGKLFALVISKLCTNNAVRIASGTKDRKRITTAGKANFRTKTNGSTRGIKVTIPHPIITNKVYVFIAIFLPSLPSNNLIE